MNETMPTTINGKPAGNGLRPIVIAPLVGKSRSAPGQVAFGDLRTVPAILLQAVTGE